MGFARKLRRKQMNVARKRFMKDFKRAMTKFKKQVVCSACSREPLEGENIDDWRINKNSENIDLICTDCYTETESEDENAKIDPST